MDVYALFMAVRRAGGWDALRFVAGERDAWADYRARVGLSWRGPVPTVFRAVFVNMELRTLAKELRDEEDAGREAAGAGDDEDSREGGAAAGAGAGAGTAAGGGGDVGAHEGGAAAGAAGAAGAGAAAGGGGDGDDDARVSCPVCRVEITGGPVSALAAHAPCVRMARTLTPLIEAAALAVALRAEVSATPPGSRYAQAAAGPLDVMARELQARLRAAFDTAPEQRAVMCGANGDGKSTFLNLLLCVFEVRAGGRARARP